MHQKWGIMYWRYVLVYTYSGLMPNCQTNLVLDYHELSLLFCLKINATLGLIVAFISLHWRIPWLQLTKKISPYVLGMNTKATWISTFHLYIGYIIFNMLLIHLILEINQWKFSLFKNLELPSFVQVEQFLLFWNFWIAQNESKRWQEMAGNNYHQIDFPNMSPQAPSSRLNVGKMGQAIVA